MLLRGGAAEPLLATGSELQLAYVLSTMSQKLKAAGFGAGDKLESAWQQHFGKETDSVGQVQFIPRQT